MAMPFKQIAEPTRELQWSKINFKVAFLFFYTFFCHLITYELFILRKHDTYIIEEISVGYVGISVPNVIFLQAPEFSG